MFLLATSALEKASSLPTSFWIKVAIGFLVFFGIVILLRSVVRVNKVVLAILGIVGMTVLFANWVYERNEPRFLTPFVDILSQFLPTKGAYEVRQASDPSKPGLQRNAPAVHPTPPRH